METAKVKMEEVREENKRLKLTLSHIMKDYDSLKKQLHGIIQEDDQTSRENLISPMAATSDDHDDDDESELVSLTLGRSSSSDETLNHKKCKLNIGLDTKSDQMGAMNKSSDESRKNDVGSKSSRSGDGDDDVEEILMQQNPLIKKPRVSVRALCNTQTMHDGCQWRKYGQKTSKGNPCPRAYYRCTVSSSCPVRKQVQRCIGDMRVLSTTYEGTHNHPLPPSAATMASATSAAVAMLTTGSYSSTSSLPNYSSNITISSLQSHPTVILDLTIPNHTTSFSSSLDFSSSNHSSFLPNNSRLFDYTSNDLKFAGEITRDPSFQTALAATITSFVGTNDSVNGRKNNHLDFSQPSTSDHERIGCATSFFNKFPQSLHNSSFTHFAPFTLMPSATPSKSLANDNQEIKFL